MKRNETIIDPAGARNAPAATDENTSTEPLDGESQSDYLKRRGEQARREAQATPEEGTPGGEPAVETLTGAAEDRAGRGKPVGSGRSFTRPDTGSSER